LPELPEVEHLRRTLAPHIVGAHVATVKLRRRDFVERSNHRRGRLTPAELLEGSTIRRLSRHGKNLAIITAEGPALGIHLGMTGMLRFIRSDESAVPKDHVHCEWALNSREGPSQLLFRDPRRFGGIWTFDSETELKRRLWNDLGPDALTIRSEDLAARLAMTSRAIKAALLDQAVLAGVGNIYADEALFSAGLHPLRPANRLSASNVDALTLAVQSVLNAALTHGGSTISSYADANGSPGTYSQVHRVYDRAGQPCPNCAKPLRNIRVCQRTTTYCTRCQPIR
jgi:formamidopyrimidine-DNA glycosylase